MVAAADPCIVDEKIQSAGFRPDDFDGAVYRRLVRDVHLQDAQTTVALAREFIQFGRALRIPAGGENAAVAVGQELFGQREADAAVRACDEVVVHQISSNSRGDFIYQSNSTPS